VLDWGTMMIESKAFKIFIKGAFLATFVIILLILFMVVNFISKIYFLDYRFDDGELKPPIEAITTEKSIRFSKIIK
jgi:hypothetical protein